MCLKNWTETLLEGFNQIVMVFSWDDCDMPPADCRIPVIRKKCVYFAYGLDITLLIGGLGELRACVENHAGLLAHRTFRTLFRISEAI